MKKYNGYVDSVKAEFGERVFSSRKRVVKFIAICFVPFLYGFVCIWAFWNPIPKIGSAPMAIVSTDAPINFIAGKTANKKFAFGEAYAYKDSSGAIVEINDDVSVDDLPNNTEIITHAGTVIIKDTATIINKSSLVDNLINSWKEGSFENISYDENSDKFTVNVDESVALTNLKYLNGKEAQEIAVQKSDGSWDVKNDSKYWVQIQIPKKLTSNIVSFLDANLQKAFGLDTKEDYVKSASYFLDDLKKFSMQFWSTYKNNFIFGQFMYILDKFKNSLIIDMGPEVISSLISFILQDSIQNVMGQLVFQAPQTVNTKLTVSDHGSSQSHDVSLNLIAGQKYVVRNKEMIGAIQKAYPDWKLPRLSIEGTTGTDISKDWETDGFLNIFADEWNKLTEGKQGEFVLNRLAKSLTKKINNNLSAGDSLEMTSEGTKKMFSTSGNIAGLLELDGSLIPETSANFALVAKGSIESKIKSYKDLIIYGKDTLSSKFNLINILSSESKANESAYVLPFGTLVKPKIGTFNYNLQRDVSAIINMFLFDKNNAQSLNSLDSGFLDIIWPNLNDLIKTTIVGSQFNPYGIGLGQFFLCIGLWVGTLMQTFIYDRAKRVKKAKPWAWYLSKTTLMLVTTWIQTTILMITVYFLGWSAIGSSFGLIYLWMMFTGSCFVVIQQALWFSFQDETIGKFLVILLLIISLSSGWGTFPTFMQAPIFNFLSYFTPYTYSIHGQGAIIYSIAIKGINIADTLFILQQLGILVVWIVLFLLLGFFVSVARNRDMLYGTHKSKKLSLILSEAKYKKYLNPKTKKVIWKNLPQEEMLDVIKKFKKRFPEETQYKWYKKLRAKKHLDKPLTASESDDEIIRRNK